MQVFKEGQRNKTGVTIEIPGYQNAENMLSIEDSGSKFGWVGIFATWLL